jgi:DNA topoisomerase-3
VKLYIAEKQTQAEALARYIAKYSGHALRTPSKYFFAVGDDIVTWAQGHLFTDGRPEDYNPIYQTWTKEHLPIFPESWLRLPAKTGNAAELLGVIKELMPKASQVIHACDYDREGQLIGDDLCDEFGVSAPVLRLPLIGYDDVSIKRAFDSMAPNESNANLANAARARRRVDWLIGYNMTRAYTIIAKEQGYRLQNAIPCGRVISPMLGLIVQRQRQIEEFLPINHFTVAAVVEGKGSAMAVKWNIPENYPGTDDKNRLTNKNEAVRVKEEIEKKKVAEVKAVASDVEYENPPLPFSMATIQQEINRRENLTAQQIYQAVQNLYNRYFLISYPRGNCRFYDESTHVDGAAVLSTIRANVPELSALASGADSAIKSAAFDSSRVGAHPAIAPLQTRMNAEDLPEVERLVYETICRRYIQQFYKPAEYLAKEFSIDIGTFNFSKRYRSLAKEGWLFAREEGPPKEKEADPPDFKVGDKLEVTDAAVIQTTTRPPKPFTDGTLIAAINSIEKYIDDPEIKAMIGSDASIGTEATQTQIIENLVAARLAERKDKKLLPTKMGRLVCSVMVPHLQGPGLTATYEKSLEKIAVGALDAGAFVRQQERLVRQMVEAALKTRLPSADEWNPTASGGPKREQTMSADKQPSSGSGGGREFGAGAA